MFVKGEKIISFQPTAQSKKKANSNTVINGYYNYPESWFAAG
jgi:hypothetical protein